VIAPRHHGASPSVRRLAASAWSFRCKVELDAAARFERMAGRLEAMAAPQAIVEMARRAAGDEQRHARLCAEQVASYGETPPAADGPPSEIAPRALTGRQKVLYEVVAACCITETESMAVLTELLGSVETDPLAAVLRELATDEVQHSRLGWAYLAHEHGQGETAFLGPLIPAMLRGTIIPDLFAPVAAEREDPALLGHGVLPHALKRQTFTRTLEEVVFPGLEEFGVDTAPARGWLADQQAALAAG
jgi:hypothetical protein